MGEYSGVLGCQNSVTVSTGRLVPEVYVERFFEGVVHRKPSAAPLKTPEW